ncbi:JHE-like carboxylesterase 1 [Penaeus vannamei]|uniref:JHE-like carboxylesterase 1 n=1 Tax=Penaeus vannamei TaxID=6689 RepID=A0A3R7LQS3_PENVA|nr:JHE-like carboxylesterase 1 [Penaeus vannamei]
MIVTPITTLNSSLFFSFFPIYPSLPTSPPYPHPLPIPPPLSPPPRLHPSFLPHILPIPPYFSSLSPPHPPLSPLHLYHPLSTSSPTPPLSLLPFLLHAFTLLPIPPSFFGLHPHPFSPSLPTSPPYSNPTPPSLPLSHPLTPSLFHPLSLPHLPHPSLPLLLSPPRLHPLPIPPSFFPHTLPIPLYLSSLSPHAFTTLSPHPHPLPIPPSLSPHALTPSPSPQPHRVSVGLPVLVYLHGGGYHGGSGESAPPHALLNEEIVLVVLQYRLGVLGFLSTEDDVIPGNFGLKDQTLGLRWVQRNIANFGGDPRRVTLLGQGAGAASAHLQMLSSKSFGLFSRVILQSGTALCPWALGGAHKQVADYTARLVGCSSDLGAHHLLQCLQAVPAGKLVHTIAEYFSNTYSPSLEEAAGEEVHQGCEAKSAEGGVTDAA